jgi:hypothetical protein
MKSHLETEMHPTVWLEMKRQFLQDEDFGGLYPDISVALSQVPELL